MVLTPQSAIYTCKNSRSCSFHVIPFGLVFFRLLEIICVDQEVAGNEHFREHSLISVRNRNHADLVSLQKYIHIDNSAWEDEFTNLFLPLPQLSCPFNLR